MKHILTAEINRLISRKITLGMLAYPLMIGIVLAVTDGSTPGFDLTEARQTMAIPYLMIGALNANTAIQLDRSSGHLPTILMWTPTRHHFYLARTLALVLFSLCSALLFFFPYTIGMLLLEEAFLDNRTWLDILGESGRWILLVGFSSVLFSFLFFSFDLTKMRNLLLTYLTTGIAVYLLWNPGKQSAEHLFNGTAAQTLTAGLILTVCTGIIFSIGMLSFLKRDIN